MSRKTTHGSLSAGLLWSALLGIAVAGEPPRPVLPAPPPSQQRTVAVDLTQVRSEVAQEINAEPELIPPVVQIPAPEAARVCGVAEAELRSASGPRGCLAQTTSMVLNMAVRREAQLKGRFPSRAGEPALPQR